MSEAILDSTVQAEGLITLASGLAVRIRPLRDGEDDLVRELCARLSERTRYLRFFLSMPVMPDSLVRMLADVVDPRRLNFIAESASPDQSDVVALGNVAAGDDGRAEIGLVVADAWQRQGIGTALGRVLLRAAEIRGYNEFLVHVLWDNLAVRRLLNRIGVIRSTVVHGGVREVTFVARADAVHHEVAAGH